MGETLDGRVLGLDEGGSAGVVGLSLVKEVCAVRGAEGAGRHFQGEGRVEVEVDEVGGLDGGLDSISGPSREVSCMGKDSQCP